jgi:putative membrane protein
MSGDQPHPTSDELAQKRTELAMDRTVIAADRTLMAWIRTSISLIGFGFTIFKFFQYLREAGQTMARPYGPRNLGLTLIAIGTVALAIAAVQHRQYLSRIGARGRKYSWSLTFIIAILIALVGVLAFVDMLLHVGPF